LVGNISSSYMVNCKSGRMLFDMSSYLASQPGRNFSVGRLAVCSVLKIIIFNIQF